MKEKIDNLWVVAKFVKSQPQIGVNICKTNDRAKYVIYEKLLNL